LTVSKKQKKKPKVADADSNVAVIDASASVSAPLLVPLDDSSVVLSPKEKKNHFKPKGQVDASITLSTSTPAQDKGKKKRKGEAAGSADGAPPNSLSEAAVNGTDNADERKRGKEKKERKSEGLAASEYTNSGTAVKDKREKKKHRANSNASTVLA
jgi:hypothetical protein